MTILDRLLFSRHVVIDPQLPAFHQVLTDAFHELVIDRFRGRARVHVHLLPLDAAPRSEGVKYEGDRVWSKPVELRSFWTVLDLTRPAVVRLMQYSNLLQLSVDTIDGDLPADADVMLLEPNVTIHEPRLDSARWLIWYRRAVFPGTEHDSSNGAADVHPPAPDQAAVHVLPVG